MKKQSKRLLSLLLFLLCLLSSVGISAESQVVKIAGREFSTAAALLDLQNVKLRDEKELLRALKKFPQLKEVRLQGSGLRIKPLAALAVAYPQVYFNTPFELAGQTFHSGDSELDFGETKLNGAQGLMWAVQLMPNLKTLTAYGITLKLPQLEQIEALRPGIQINTTLRFLRYSLRTDTTAFSTRKGNEAPFWKNRDFEILRYCPNLLALDLGHNRVSDLSFLRQWPGLKILIMADNAITDLSVIGELRELEYLELFMNPFTDVTPLTQLTKLKDLNISWTATADVSVLSQMTWLERLWITQIKPKLPEGQVEALKAALPNTEINDTAWLATQGGWREHPRYRTMANIFGVRVWRNWNDPKPDLPII